MYEDIPSDSDHEDNDLLDWENAVQGEIREVFEPDPNMPAEDELEILNFLNRFKVKEAPEANRDTLSIIWASLSRNPSVVKDFTYLLTDINTDYNYSEYPLPISVEDIVEWCDELGGSESSIRMRLVDEVVVPNIVRLGYDEDKVRMEALGEFHGLPATGEKIRFLGWLVGQKFISANISGALRAYLDRKGISESELYHLALVAESLVRRELRLLKERGAMYERQTFLIERARSAHDDRVYAMEGINNMCQDLFHKRSA